MSNWSSELERLSRPTDFDHAELHSSRQRMQQKQQQQQQPAVHPASYAEPGTSSEGLDSARPSPCEACPSLSSASPSNCFCPSCDRLLCRACDSRLHASSSISNAHVRLPASHALAYRLPCPEAHPIASSSSNSSSNHRLTLFCRTCSRAVCQQCTQPGGSHSSSAPSVSTPSFSASHSKKAAAAHDCVRLEEEYARQMERLRASVGSDSALHTKKMHSINELRSLDAASFSLTSLCSSIESQEHSRAQQILYRLSNVQQMNEMRVTQSVERIKGDIADIDAFLTLTALATPAPAPSSSPSPSSFTSASSAASEPMDPAPVMVSPANFAAAATPTSMCRFLASMRQWQQTAEQLASTPVDQDVIPPPPTSIGTGAPGENASESGLPQLEPLPREMRAQRAKESEFAQLLSLLRVKDELLRFAMASRKGLLAEQEQHAQTLSRLYEQSQQEMEEWLRLSDTLRREVAKYKQACCFCGVPLSGSSASASCTGNQQQQMGGARTPLLQQLQPNSTDLFEGSERREGDGLHYFVPSI